MRTALLVFLALGLGLASVPVATAGPPGPLDEVFVCVEGAREPCDGLVCVGLFSLPPGCVDP